MLQAHKVLAGGAAHLKDKYGDVMDIVATWDILVWPMVSRFILPSLYALRFIPPDAVFFSCLVVVFFCRGVYHCARRRYYEMEKEPDPYND